MKHIDISKNVMNSVTRFETKRSSSLLVKLSLVLGVVLLILLVLALGIYYQLAEQDTFSLFTLFTQDKEVIALFWRDTLQTMIEEIPMYPLSLSIFLFSAMVLIGVVFRARIGVAWRRLLTVHSMKKSSFSPFYLPLSIILGVGIAGVVLLGVFGLSKKTPAPSVSNQQQETGTESSASSLPSSGTDTSTGIQKADVSLPVSQGLSLMISSPQHLSTVSTSSVVIKGTTSPKAEVFVNDKDLIADSKGNFSVTVNLDEGENTISVSANDADGNFAAEDIVVTYEPAS